MGHPDYGKVQTRKELFVRLTAERDRTSSELMAAASSILDRLTTMSSVDELVLIIRDAAIVLRPAFLADKALEDFNNSDD